MPDGVDSGADAGADSRWARILDRFDADAAGAVAAAAPEPAEHDAAEDAGIRALPEGAGALPAALLPRAHAVLAAQRHAIAAVRRAMAEASAELSAARSGPDLTAPSVPLYLDRVG